MLQHTLICGTTGSGKTYLERMIIGPMAERHTARMVLIDPKGIELDQWADAPDTIAYSDSPSGNYDAIIRAYDQMNLRFSATKRKNRENKTPGRPYDGLPLYVFVDEAGSLMEDRKHRASYLDMLAGIAEKGRAARVFLVWCTQMPTRRNIPEAVAANLDNKVCLRLDNMSRAQYVFGPGYQYGDLPRYGYGYVRTPDMLDGPRKMRVDDEMLGALGIERMQ